jgi:sporulation protein YlmC with PRC-barrel domain
LIRLSDLDDKLIRTSGGKKLGRVHDVRIEGSQVRWLEYGSRGVLERLRGKGEANRIPWSDVREVRADAIMVDEP